MNRRATPAVQRFEEEFARLRRRQRLQLVGFAIVFLVARPAAAEVSNFTLERLLAGLPRIGEYIGKTLPEIRLGSAAGGHRRLVLRLPRAGWSCCSTPS